MSLDNYTNLKVEIENTLDRDDLAPFTDSFIDLAETRHKREIRIREMIRRSQAQFSTRYLALPAEFLEMRSLLLLTSPVTVLSEVNFDQMNRLRRETARKPEHFTVHEEVEFDMVPGSTLTAEMIYYAEFEPLSDTNPTNALLSRAPDAYLYGSLVAAEPFLDNDERLRVWVSLYEAARDSVNAMDRRKGGPLVSKVVGATP